MVSDEQEPRQLLKTMIETLTPTSELEEIMTQFHVLVENRNKQIEQLELDNKEKEQSLRDKEALLKKMQPVDLTVYRMEKRNCQEEIASLETKKQQLEQEIAALERKMTNFEDKILPVQSSVQLALYQGLGIEFYDDLKKVIIRNVEKNSIVSQDLDFTLDPFTMTNYFWRNMS